RPGALPAVIVPLSRKAGRSLLSPSNVVSGRGASSTANGSTPFLPRTSTATISPANLPAFCAAAEALLRALGETVLHRAGELRLGDQILGVPAGMLAGEGVVEAVAQHAVVQLGGTHAVAPAAAVHQVGR